MMTYQMGIVKSVSENEIVLSTGKQEYVIPLSPEEAKGLHQVLLNNEFVLIPFNEHDKKLALNNETNWSESDLEELQGNDDYETDDEGNVL